MATETDDQRLARILADRGIRAATEDEWTSQMAIDAMREQQRRHAGDPHMQQLMRLAGRVTERLGRVVDVPPADAAAVLMAASGLLGTPVVLHNIPAHQVLTVAQLVAVLLDDQAKAGAES